jgi:hypothetical protein
MPEEVYLWTAQTYEALALAGVSPLAVADVLHNYPIVRRHIGASLQVFGRDHAGTWLAVALVEGDDDLYTITGARYLDGDEIAAICRVTKE